ncbi:protein FAM149B1-like [Pristis pectinata]|uniref:protein FAM149B1-like n=1 Tax=Pristis pectinata TaxID=685728 RepID=UPI00223D36BB|nr:protein FAM149B1-like [Pristis pectinata]
MKTPPDLGPGRGCDRAGEGGGGGMIRRYNRRPVCNTLEICGLLQSSTDSHPLPDKQGEYSAPSPITSIEDADSISSGESKISEDTNSHFLLADIGRPWSAMNSYTETRLSTACSSTFSWGDNEFETAASQQVQQMFFEIDELLFEEKKCSRVQRLEEECQEWKCSFPHFRVLGTQIAAPVNEAYGWYPGRDEGKTPQPTSIPGSDTAVNELCLIGKSATFSGLSLCKGNDFMQKTAMLPWEEEEAEPEDNVIIAEGIVEEYLALHYRDWEDDCFETRLDLSLQYENRSGLPPISPSHCRRDTIVTELFDEVWLEVVGCMEELIRKHWDRHVSDEDKNISSIENTGFDPFNFLLPPVPQVQQTHIGMVQTKPNSLHIQGIPFSHRNLPVPEKVEDPDERPVLWPYSSNHPANRFPSNHLLEHSICSLSQPLHSTQRLQGSAGTRALVSESKRGNWGHIEWSGLRGTGAPASARETQELEPQRVVRECENQLPNESEWSAGAG